MHRRIRGGAHRRQALAVLVLAASGVCLLALARAGLCADWPQWRGPARTGVSLEKGLLRAWPAGGPKLVWQVKDQGYGFGSLAVVRGRVYLVGSTGLDEEAVVALDAASGAQVWRAVLGPVGSPNQRPSYPGARSTPTVDGSRLYALSSAGDLACLDAASGKVVWRKSLVNDFGARLGVWALAESPLVEGNLVIVTPGGPGAGVVALEKATGSVVWKTALTEDDGAAYASAVTASFGGARQVVQFLSKGLAGIDIKTGKVLWRYARTSDRMGVNAFTPLVWKDTVFSGGTRSPAALARVTATGGTFTLADVFVAPKAPTQLGGAVLIGDCVYGASPQSLLCLSLTDGALKWEDRSIGASAVCAADGLLFLHGENGDVALVEATPEAYREKGRFTPPDPPARRQERAWQHPVVANGRLFIREQGTVWCYDVKGSAAAR